MAKIFLQTHINKDFYQNIPQQNKQEILQLCRSYVNIKPAECGRCVSRISPAERKERLRKRGYSFEPLPLERVVHPVRRWQHPLKLKIFQGGFFK